MNIRRAPFAFRVVRRREGPAAIIYRRATDEKTSSRLRRVAAISPHVFTLASPVLREAARAAGDRRRSLAPGPFYPLDHDWGARIATLAIVTAGLRDPDGIARAIAHLRRADPAEAAWWLGLMTRSGGERAVRALRILTEAVR